MVLPRVEVGDHFVRSRECGRRIERFRNPERKNVQPRGRESLSPSDGDKPEVRRSRHHMHHQINILRLALVGNEAPERDDPERGEICLQLRDEWTEICEKVLPVRIPAELFLEVGEGHGWGHSVLLLLGCFEVAVILIRAGDFKAKADLGPGRSAASKGRAPLNSEPVGH
jgi:hypothetical protein